MKDEASPPAPRWYSSANAAARSPSDLDTGSACQQAAGPSRGCLTQPAKAYPCSKDGQERLRQAIAEQKLERVLIAGCTPRLVEKLFRQAVQPALEPGYLDVANIREQRLTSIPADTTRCRKAAEHHRYGCGTPGDDFRSPAATPAGWLKSALVIGSGLSALTVALALADGDIRVTLVERIGSLGSSIPDLQERTRQLLTEKIQAVMSHPMIDTLFNAHMVERERASRRL